MYLYTSSSSVSSIYPQTYSIETSLLCCLSARHVTYHGSPSLNLAHSFALMRFWDFPPKAPWMSLASFFSERSGAELSCVEEVLELRKGECLYISASRLIFLTLAPRILLSMSVCHRRFRNLAWTFESGICSYFWHVTLKCLASRVHDLFQCEIWWLV